MAGRGEVWLEAGETIRDAAIRETQEEAGIVVEPTSLLRVEQQWFASETGEGLVSWWRYVVRAHAVGSLTPKHRADRHSLEARWVRPEAIGELLLRHPEVIDLVALALANPAAMPLVA